MKRAQSARESPAGVRSGLREKWRCRRQKPSWNHDSALLLVWGGGGGEGGEGDAPSTGAAERGGEQDSKWATICIIHALIYNKRHTF